MDNDGSIVVLSALVPPARIYPSPAPQPFNLKNNNNVLQPFPAMLSHVISFFKGIQCRGSFAGLVTGDIHVLDNSTVTLGTWPNLSEAQFPLREKPVMTPPHGDG